MINDLVLRICAANLAFVCLNVTQALGQSFPAKPIRMIVPLAAGGSVDVITRPVADVDSIELE